MSADPAWLDERVMRSGVPLRPRGTGRGAIRALGIDGEQRSAAHRWFAACVALMVEGFLLYGVGWVLDRFVGVGAGLMLFGSVMWVVALIGMLLTPLAWAADLAVQGVRESRSRGDHTA